MQQIGGMLGEILEQGGLLAKMTGKALVATPGSLVKTAASQVTNTPLNDNTSGKKTDAAELQKQQDDFVKDLYGANDTNAGQNAPDQQNAVKASSKNEKSPEEQQKIEALKQQLHSQYFQRLTAPPKAPEKPVAEKLEDEKMQERWELQEKEAKEPKNLDIIMASQKTERFRGASG